MKYDIQIIMPVCGRPPYLQRLNNFKEYGLLNVASKKVLLTLLVGNEEIQGILNDWPENVEVEVVGSERQFPYHTVELANHRNHRTMKIVEYFLNYDPQKLKDVCWIAKFDDDSMNDISNLVNNLNTDYDHTREYYIVTEFRTDIELIDAESLRLAGYKRWLVSNGNTAKGIFHELEGSIMSNTALQRILNTPDAVQYLKNRLHRAAGHTDVPLAHAARIAKICSSEAYFITQHPAIGLFSFFGNGPFNHIHYVAADRNPGVFKVIKKMMGKGEKYNGKNKEIYDLFKNGEFIFGNTQTPARPFGVMSFSESGVILNGSHNESIWHVKNGNIEILNAQAELTTILEYEGDNNYLEGQFMPDPNVKHFIRRLIVEK